MPTVLTLPVRTPTTFNVVACSDTLTCSDARPCGSGGLVVRS
jgi:hypothetical protein